MRVTVNAAMSADGKIALRGGKQLAISDAEDLARVHRMRSEHDAVCVGIGTVLADDPQLTARHVTGGRNPTRVLLDSKGRIPPKARVLDGSAKTLHVVTEGHARSVPNAETIVAGDGEQVDLRLALRELQARGIQSLLVEGGAQTIGSFLRHGLVNDLYTYVGPLVVGGGAPSLVEGPGATLKEHVLRMRLAEVGRVGEGVLLHWVPR